MKTGSGTAGLRARHRLRTEQEIRAAALTIIAARGFDDATIEEIATAAGVSRRTVFRYFPSKVDLVFGNQQRVVEMLREALHSTAGSGASRVEHLRHVLLSAQFGPRPAEQAAREAEIARLVARHPALEAHATRLSTDFEHVIADYLTASGASDRSARFLAGALFGALRAARHEAVDSSTAPPELVAIVFDVLTPAFNAALPLESR